MEPVPWSRFGAAPWSLEPPEVDDLMGRIRERGTPLAKFLGVKSMYGIKTGLNEDFLIDDATRVDLLRADPGCASSSGSRPRARAYRPSQTVPP